jgi:hypothetical protein
MSEILKKLHHEPRSCKPLLHLCSPRINQRVE